MPKPFQGEVTFSGGDAVTITAAKVKQEQSDAIFARKLVKRQDTILFRDNKGNPMWD